MLFIANADYLLYLIDTAARYRPVADDFELKVAPSGADTDAHMLL
jgi:hypothetical protein